MLKPIVATNRPMPVKDTATPSARAMGPPQLSLAAVPNTIGRSGNTHGERMDKRLAMKAGPQAPKVIAAARHIALATRAAIQVGLVSPTERPVFGPFLKVMSVLCIRAEALNRILLGVEVDMQHEQLVVVRLLLDVRQDRRPRLAHRAPGGVDFDERRPRCLLPCVKGGRGLGDRLRGHRRSGDGHGYEGDRGKNSMAD
jgi:hypothetical protein